MTDTATDLVTSTADTVTAAASAPAEALPHPTGEGTDSPAREPGRPRGGRGQRGRDGNRGEGSQGGTGGGDRQGGQTRQAGKPARPQAGREVHPVLQKLFALYPAMFGARFLPLKLGVFQDLLALHPDEFKRDELKVALGLHARSTRYLESVAAGHQRHDLNAQPVEPVAPEHVHHAILEVFRRRQARSRDDLRPYLRTNIINAIEASGLPRQEYADRVRTQDEDLNAVLDDALGELAQQAARREALLRSFEATGKTVDAFADMYGLDLKEATQTLERARQERDAPALVAAPATAPAATGASTGAAEDTDVNAPAATTGDDKP
ncbi:MAG: ProQ/FINO family protein [Polaromonas sp.]|nr:ProQ/FINO family protein [Polaromonas sp.]